MHCLLYSRPFVQKNTWNACTSIGCSYINTCSVRGCSAMRKILLQSSSPPCNLQTLRYFGRSCVHSKDYRYIYPVEIEQPWRKFGIHHTKHTVYIDVIEELDVHLDNQGKREVRVRGAIDMNCQFPGIPDFELSFNNGGLNPRALANPKFHYCVRHKRWMSERVLCFIPPDGEFRIFSYHFKLNQPKFVARNSGRLLQIPLPCSVWTTVDYNEQPNGVIEGALDISIKALPWTQYFAGELLSLENRLEQVLVMIPFPDTVSDVRLYPGQGDYEFDKDSKILQWRVGTVKQGSVVSCRGDILMDEDAEEPDDLPFTQLFFTTVNSRIAPSSLKVALIEMPRKYMRHYEKRFPENAKGNFDKILRYITKGGVYRVQAKHSEQFLNEKDKILLDRKERYNSMLQLPSDPDKTILDKHGVPVDVPEYVKMKKTPLFLRPPPDEINDLYTGEAVSYLENQKNDMYDMPEIPSMFNRKNFKK